MGEGKQSNTHFLFFPLYDYYFYFFVFLQMEIFQGACEGGHLGIIKLLFERGWCSDTQDEVLYFYLDKQVKKSLIILLYCQNMQAFVRALRICCKKGDLEIVKLMLEMGPKLDIEKEVCVSDIFQIFFRFKF